MRRLAPLFTLIACLVPASALAQDAPASSAIVRAESNRDTIRSSVNRLFTMPILEQGPVGAISRMEWEARMEQAFAKRRRATQIALGGIGMAGAGLVVAMVSDSVSAAKTGGMLATAGSGVAIYGWLLGSSAEGEIEDLDLLGRANGYLSLSPTADGGALLAMTLDF